MYIQDVRYIYIFVYLYRHDTAPTASLGLALPVWARNPGCAALPGAGNGFIPWTLQTGGSDAPRGVWVSGAALGGKAGGYQWIFGCWDGASWPCWVQVQGSALQGVRKDPQNHRNTKSVTKSISQRINHRINHSHRTIETQNHKIYQLENQSQNHRISHMTTESVR